MTLTDDHFKQACKKLVDPITGQSLLIRNVSIEREANAIVVDLQTGYPIPSHYLEIKKQLTAILNVTDDAHDFSADHATDCAAARPIDDARFQLNISHKVVPHAVQRGLKRLPGVRNTIVVASGKGGVGKSTTAVNLAFALLAEGARVGMLDADIYGPSLPTMLGKNDKPVSLDGKLMQPLIAHNCQFNSIGLLVDSHDAVIWRGPMATNALTQLATHTAWDDLDYLIIDMPPGTGDIQLTLAQRIPVSGVVIVTTPQDIALIDARRSAKMFEKVGIPIIGIIENMSAHRCSNCGHIESIFGEGGAESLANDLTLPLLGSIPLDRYIRQQADQGYPNSDNRADEKISDLYAAIARQTISRLATFPRDYSDRMPPVVMA